MPPMPPDILTTRDVARALGLSEQRVRQLADRRGIGRQLPDGTWIFSPADLSALAIKRAPGRPRKVRDGLD